MASPRHPVPATPIPASVAGIGLRAPHHRALAEARAPVGWLEAHAENYLDGGPNSRLLEQLRADHPIGLHCVGLSLGSADGIDRAHLARIADLVHRVEPALVSEHVAWCSTAEAFLNDLLPLPWTEEALKPLVENVDAMQTALGLPVLVENPSSYMAFADSVMTEWEFLAALAERTGCGLLLDVNNVYVSAQNLGFDPRDYLAAVPAERVGEIHLAGHHVNRLEDGDVVYIDDHGSTVADPVWELFAETAARCSQAPVLIEWDTRIPALDVLVAEAAKADAIIDAARGPEARHAGMA